MSYIFFVDFISTKCIFNNSILRRSCPLVHCMAGAVSWQAYTLYWGEPLLPFRQLGHWQLFLLDHQQGSNPCHEFTPLPLLNSCYYMDGRYETKTNLTQLLRPIPLSNPRRQMPFSSCTSLTKYVTIRQWCQWASQSAAYHHYALIHRLRYLNNDELSRVRERESDQGFNPGTN